MRNRLFAVFLALLLPILIVISPISPVFADHTYLGLPVNHANFLFDDFVIDYQSFGGEIINVQADINNKKLFVYVKIAATPAFLEINLPRDLLDAKDSEEDGNFKIIYEGNRAGFDEIQTLWNSRTLNIQLRGVSVSEIVEIEILGTHIFDKTTLKEPEHQELTSKENTEKFVTKEKLETKTTKETKPDKNKEKKELEPKSEIKTEAKEKPNEEIEITNEQELDETIINIQELEDEVLEPVVELEPQIKLETEVDQEDIESQNVLEINEESKLVELQHHEETKTKQKHEPQPKPAITAIQMIEFVRMLEPIQNIEPQVVEPIQEIFEPIHDEAEELKFEEEMETRAELIPVQAEEESKNSTNEPNNLTNTLSSVLIYEEQLEPDVDTNDLDTIQEDSCFICKNKKKQESKQLQFQQLEETVVQQEPIIEKQKSEVNFISELLKQFQELFGWLIVVL
jgi:hypothetical protein